MPTYEYVCRDCGQHLEVVQSFKDAPLQVCGSCGGGLRKVFGAAGIIFKGSGYYVTDSRAIGAAAGAKAASKGERAASSPAESSGSGGSSGSGEPSGESSPAKSSSPTSGSSGAGVKKSA